MSNTTHNTDEVRMEYTGQNVGAITFHGPSGQQYRGGNNDFDRYANVQAGDVAHLEATGRWATTKVTKDTEPTPTGTDGRADGNAIAVPLTTAEAAVRLNLDPAKVRKLIDDGTLNATKNDREQWEIEAASVDAYQIAQEPVQQ